MRRAASFEQGAILARANGRKAKKLVKASEKPTERLRDIEVGRQAQLSKVPGKLRRRSTSNLRTLSRDRL